MCTHGARAANGVIMVTTKQGKAGKVTVTYDANVDFYIPSRETEGYGLNNAAVKSLCNSGTSLIATITGSTTIFPALYSVSLSAIT